MRKSAVAEESSEYDLMSKARTFWGITVLFLAIVFTANAATAQSQAPSGKISIETTSIAAGIGFSWGNGKLNFNGKEYRFSIDGVTLLDVGISKSSAAGEVYNLTDLAEFEGNYVAAEASFALGGGVGGVSLRNPNGVVMHLNSVAQGARLQLGSSGMNIKLW
jgi:hypothetical protein